MLGLLSCGVDDPSLQADGTLESIETAIVISTQGAASEDGTLWVMITEPLDGTVVQAQTILVKGEAPLETVVSINDSFVYVQNGAFELEVPLELGDNLFEITASDIEGNEVTLYLLVTSE